MSVDFTKIKFDGSKVLLKWTSEKSDVATRETTYTCSDGPHTDFYAALAHLVAPVRELLEVDEAWIGPLFDENGAPDANAQFRVTGLSINYQDDGCRGVVVTCQRKLAGANAPLVVNTPHLPEEDPDNPSQPCMSTGMVFAVNAVCREAQRYLDGHRAQADMFAEAA